MILPSLPSEASLFVPHRDTMLLLDKLEKVVPDLGQARAVIKSDNIFFHENTGLDPVAFIELMAQTAAAYNGYEDIKNDRNVRTGLLVGIKNFRLTGCQVNKGDTLRIEIRRTFEINNATVIDGTVTSSDQKTIAEGTLNVWILDEAPPFSSVAAPDPRSSDIKDDMPEWLTQNRNRSSAYILEHLQILNGSVEALNAAISFESKFIGFSGHFPGTPILPGIIMLQIAALTAELLLQKRLTIKTVDKVKFMGTVMPDRILQISGKLISDGDGWQTGIQLNSDGKKLAAIVMSVEAEK
ncbi:MAG: hypothetical protein K9L30_07165 [Desulfobacterales bacterium]|nr:hypothetical protein [Desulfobacterales bacterium]